MKRIFFVAAAIVLIGSLVRADTSAAPAGAKVHPCKDLEAACKAAGYHQGGAKDGSHKGLWEHCMDPILKGGPAPAGVTVDPALLSECQAYKASHPGHNGHPKSGAAPVNTTAPTGAPQ